MRKVLFVLLAAACAEAPPVKTTLPVHSLKTPEPVSKDGVGLTLDPITYDGWKNHGAIVMKISWQEIDRNAPVSMSVAGRGGSGSPRTSTVTRSEEIPLLPLPAIQVAIENKSGKPLDFAKAHIELSDGQHHWKLMDSVGDVQGRVQNDVMSSHNVADNRPLLDGLASAVAQLPIANSKLTIAPGQTWQGFLVFHMDTHDADELNDLLDKADKLTLAADLGGTSFSVELPRQTQQKSYTCPGDLKKPSFKKCKEG
jgi:hypothetical protein